METILHFSVLVLPIYLVYNCRVAHLHLTQWNKGSFASTVSYSNYLNNNNNIKREGTILVCYVGPKFYENFVFIFVF